ncbi:TrgA family protein [Pseudotabrizicola algicola]|uniref:TrgA family protein n=1 Tax=Pseudotabrizicola algicola TaxID=2709381 RepID=A0A6B3RK90_9RHOB|nr:TrgA family protein [Pseudotabrizicola algicola]NEX45523.1 TrgA family protein [Pseudotabrizicola algicola]
MPTAAKLFAAIAFALVSAVTAHFYVLSLPESRPVGALYLVSVAVGIICGWLIMGPAAKRARGRVDAMGSGVRTALTIAVVVVLIFACADMLDRALKGRYKTPLDALLGVFEQALVLAPPLARPDIIGVMLLGGLLSGAVAHWAGRRWP